jgi:hypothetical protein
MGVAGRSKPGLLHVPLGMRACFFKHRLKIRVAIV